MRSQTSISSKLSESLSAFLEQISLTMADNTVKAYKYDLERFKEFLEDNGIYRVTGVKREHVIKYLSTCKASGKSDKSIERYYVSIRSCFNFLFRHAVVKTNVVEEVEMPKSARKSPRIPTVEEVQRILASPIVDNEIGVRDRAILELLYSSGLRASELCDLELKDVTPSCVRVDCGKGDKTRTVPLTREAYRWIETYIERYRTKQPGYLFLSCMGNNMTRQKLSEMVVRHAKRAEVDEVTPHTLRHACATHLLDKGANLRLIQEVLGHASIASTERYTHLSAGQMQDMFKQFHPRSNYET